jgi:hypothetical protein
MEFDGVLVTSLATDCFHLSFRLCPLEHLFMMSYEKRPDVNGTWII